MYGEMVAGLWHWLWLWRCGPMGGVVGNGEFRARGRGVEARRRSWMPLLDSQRRITVRAVPSEHPWVLSRPRFRKFHESVSDDELLHCLRGEFSAPLIVISRMGRLPRASFPSTRDGRKRRKRHGASSTTLWPSWVGRHCSEQQASRMRACSSVNHIGGNIKPFPRKSQSCVKVDRWEGKAKRP